jgi:hypothetical protein
MTIFQAIDTRNNTVAALLSAPSFDVAVKRAQNEFALFDHVERAHCQVVIAPDQHASPAVDRFGWEWL